MTYSVTDLVGEIRIALDQNMNSEALTELNDIDTLSLDELIKSKVEDAARMVVMLAPAVLLGSGKAFGDTIGWDMQAGYGSGHIVLPDDFLRLIVFQMSDWSMPVTVAIDETSPLYSRQKSRYAGVRGNPQRPVVAIVQQPIGNVLEFYSCEQGEHVYIKMARYAPIPKRYTLDEEEVIDLPDKLVRPVVYYAAYLVAVAQQQTEQANGCMAVCKGLLGVRGNP
ncbi:MAG: hypothetical protein IKO85_08040 [Bacteroidaceae bacterium]|nr:hypothetical protein [Bacteroidaceae bacterium]